jgi:putative ABC transport system permease protein
VNKQISRPPLLAEKLMRLFLRQEERFEKIGDFCEGFLIMVEENGKWRARIWYWGQVLKTIPLFCKNLLFWRFGMFKSYLINVFRNIQKNKVFSFIVIVGFSFGLACFLLIATWVQNELSFDRFHSKSGLIYKVDTNAFFQTEDVRLGTQTNYTGPMLEKDLPEIEKSLRLTSSFRTSVVKVGKDKIFREEKLVYSDPAFFDFFDFPLKLGNQKEALNDPSSVVISTEIAQKYFPRDNPMEKMLEINAKFYKVSGVCDVRAVNSHINFDFLIALPPFAFEADEFQNLNLAYLTYILVKDGTDINLLQKKVHRLVNEYIKPVVNTLQIKNLQYNIILRPLKDIYLRSPGMDTFRFGSMTNIYIMLAVSFILLFIVSFNYMNLTLSRSLLRTKEIGLRKIVGARTSQIRGQLLGETLIQTVLATGVAFFIASLVSPIFNRITGKTLNLIYLSLGLLPIIILIILLVVLLSGLYPAIFLSRIIPINLLQSKFFSGITKTIFRKVMVIVQFALSIILIISTLFIAKQINYMKSKDLGFEKNNRMILNLANSQYVEKYGILKTSLQKIPGVESISVSSTIPGKFSGQNPFSIKGETSRQFLWMYFVDYDFIPTFGLKLTQGRNFSKHIASDKNETAIINETTVKKMGIKNAIGAIIQDQSDNRTYRVIGIIKDFHNESLHGEIKPLIIRCIHTDFKRSYKDAQFLTAVIKKENLLGTVSAIKQNYSQLVPDQHFEYFFLADLFDSLYNEDVNFKRIFIYSSGLAIFLSCLGLFGLSIFVIQRKIKEIAIRKVLGASVSKILLLLTRDFMRWILLANVIAWPIVYIAVKKWLQNYAYRTPIEIWTFILAGLLTLFIALLTVCIQAIKTATANPVDSLRYE